MARDDRGAATTELVFAAPLLFFVVMLLVQTGLWYHAGHVAQAAAQEGVAAGRVENGTRADAAQRATSFLDRVGNRIFVSRNVTADRGPEVVTVRVTGRALNVVPGLRFSIDETAESPVERFRPS